MTEHRGWQVWEFTSDDCIAAKTLDDAVAFQAEEIGESVEWTRETVALAPCDLERKHLRNVFDEEEGECTFRETIDQILANAERRGSGPGTAFMVSRTDW